MANAFRGDDQPPKCENATDTPAAQESRRATADLQEWVAAFQRTTNCIHPSNAKGRSMEAERVCDEVIRSALTARNALKKYAAELSKKNA